MDCGYGTARRSGANAKRDKIGKMDAFGKEPVAQPPRETRRLQPPLPFEPAPFRPAAWLPGPHAQTVAGRLLRRPSPLSFRRERLELPYGDFVDIDHAPGPPEPAAVVLLVHGLEGSARRGYAVNVYRELARRGIGAVGLNFRSCSGEPNRLARSYHSGDTADITHVLRLLAARHAGVPRGAIGFSLGGNALLKLLGEAGDGAGALVQAAVAVSVPYDLAAGADSLQRTWAGRLYTTVFLKTLIAKTERKAALLDVACDMEKVRAARSFRAFDDAATAPLHGFAGADDYYARCSSRHHIASIRVPTLLLHSADDPFLPGDCLPRRDIAANPWIQAAITPGGGHVGFIGGSPWAPRFWAEEQAARYLAEQLLIDSPATDR
jgi:uncharacterized protein